MALFGAVCLGLSLAISSYRVVLTDRSLHLQFGLRAQRIPLSAVEKVTVAPRAVAAVIPDPAGALEGVVHAYPSVGARETVCVHWRQGARTKTTLIATDRAAQLAAAVNDGAARASVPPRARTVRATR